MSSRAKQAGRFLAVYTALFAVLFLAVFSAFIATGTSFIWSADGLTQHVRALTYYGMILRDTIGSVFSAQGFQAPTFSFGLGYGADILDTLNYYAIGDPLNLVAVFVPADYTPVLYNVLVVVRIYLAGLAFNLFVNYVFRAPLLGRVSGALTYAFCGFALFACIRHPYFMNPLIYLPLVLYGVERVLRERKSGVFALSLTLCAVSNFYFFYMVFLLMAIYIVVRLVALHRGEGAQGVRRAFADFGRLVLAGVVGLLVSCIVFVPIVLFFMQDTRQSVDFGMRFIYSFSYYKSLLLSISTFTDTGYWTFPTVGIVGLIAIGALFADRGNGQLKVFVCLAFVMLCIPVFGRIFNGFSYVTNRWSWAFCFVACCIIAAKWDSLLSMSRKRALVMVVLVVVYLALSFGLNISKMPTTGALIVAALWLFTACVIAFLATRGQGARATGLSRATPYVLALAVCCGIALNALIIYSPMGGNYVQNFLKWSDFGDIYRSEAPAVATFEEGLNDGDDFYRYSGSRLLMTRNAASSEGVSSTASYWSLTHASAKQFFDQMGVNGSDSGGCCWYDLNGQSMLAELLGVKHFLAYPNYLLPFGFGAETVAEGEYYDPRYKEMKQYEVHENQDPLPFGFTYRNTLSSESFLALEPHQRREAVLQSCVVSNANTKSKGELNLISQVVPYTLKLGKGVTQDGMTFTVTKKNAKITLVAKCPAEAEVSLQLVTPRLESKSSSPDLVCSFGYDDDSKYETQMPLATTESNTYEPFSSLATSPGYSAKSVKKITVTFPATGEYSFDDVQVIAQPMTNFNQQVQELQQDVLEDVDLHYLSKKTAATNRVTGSITLDEPKVLCTQIPYSEGWSVRVDGHEADLLQLNVMQSGVQLEAGAHQVEFLYETPGLRAGAIITGVGIILFALMLVLERRARNSARGAHAAGVRSVDRSGDGQYDANRGDADRRNASRANADDEDACEDAVNQPNADETENRGA